MCGRDWGGFFEGTIPRPEKIVHTDRIAILLTQIEAWETILKVVTIHEEDAV